MADIIANAFRRVGAALPPDEVNVKWEEDFFLEDKGCVIQGDVRKWCKEAEERVLMSEWRKRTDQSRWSVMNAPQIMRMSHEVWNWSIRRGDGDAWIYWIFGITNWLPFGEKGGKKAAKKDRCPPYQHCRLCCMREVDNFEHMMCCPALAKELAAMDERIETLLTTLVPENGPRYLRALSLVRTGYSAQCQTSSYVLRGHRVSSQGGSTNMESTGVFESSPRH